MVWTLEVSKMDFVPTANESSILLPRPWMNLLLHSLTHRMVDSYSIEGESVEERRNMHGSSRAA